MRRAQSPSRGVTKGRVERAIRYLRDSFFAARSFRSVEDLNRQLGEWTEKIAHVRLVPADTDKRRVHEAAALAASRTSIAHPWAGDYVRATASGKSPYVRFDKND